MLQKLLIHNVKEKCPNKQKWFAKVQCQINTHLFCLQSNSETFFLDILHILFLLCTKITSLNYKFTHPQMFVTDCYNYTDTFHNNIIQTENICSLFDIDEKL